MSSPLPAHSPELLDDFKAALVFTARRTNSLLQEGAQGRRTGSAVERIRARFPSVVPATPPATFAVTLRPALTTDKDMDASPTPTIPLRGPRFTSPAVNTSRTPSPTVPLRGPRFTSPRNDTAASTSRTASPTDGLRGAPSTARQADDEPPSPPPSRPRSSSMPVSMGTGRLRSRRPDESASGSGNVAVPVAGDVVMTDDASTSAPSRDELMAIDPAAPPTDSADVAMADEPSTSTTTRPTAFAARRHSMAQTLPLDVLSLIILAWYDAEVNDSIWTARRIPFAASRICGSWRYAAQSTHRLWTDASFSLSAMVGRRAWLAYQECYARFSGALSVSVRISCDASAAPAGDRAWELFRARILPRARVIDVEVEELTSFTGVLAGLALPHLTTLRVSSSCHLPPQDYPFMDFDDVMDQATNPLWGARTLEVERAEYTLGELRGLASVTPELVDFSMTVQGLWDTEDEPFVWARLEVLRVDVQTIYSESMPYRLQLPALRLLEIRDIKYNWGFWRQFVEVSCPGLEQLCVVRNHMDQGQQFVEGMGALRQIRRLILRDGSLNEHLIWLLVSAQQHGLAFPNLRDLSFENTVAKPGFRFPGLQNFLRLRYDYLQRSQIGGIFDLRCTFRRRVNDEAHNALQSSVESQIAGWNLDARRAYVA